MIDSAKLLGNSMKESDETDKGRRCPKCGALLRSMVGSNILGQETSRTLQLAIDGDRDAAIDIWRYVERYPTDHDSIIWAQEVACRILQAIPQKDARRRADALQKAVGLFGPQDKHRKLRDFVEGCRAFEDLDRTEPPERGEENERIIKAIRQRARQDLHQKDPQQRFFTDYDDKYLTKIENQETFTDDDLKKLVSRYCKKTAI